jgi:hypothetical protein
MIVNKFHRKFKLAFMLETDSNLAGKGAVYLEAQIHISGN